MMHGEGDPTTGRGMLLFAAIMFGFGLYVGISGPNWEGATLWLALAGFMGCFGALMLNLLPRLHRALLVVGFIAGALAFVLAVRMTLGA